MRTSAARRFATLSVLLALIVSAPTGPAPIVAAHADADHEGALVAAINDAREEAGLAALSTSDELVHVARGHSEAMAAFDVLHHDPALGEVVGDWRRLGENVGRGADVAALHDAFMDSPTHAANVLGADYDEVGVGAVVVDGRLWVTQVFRSR